METCEPVCREISPRPTARRCVEKAPHRVCVGNVLFDNVRMEEAIARVDVLVQAKRPAFVVTPNVDHVVRVQKDREYASIVRTADLVLADGQPIVWWSRALGTPLKERVAGSDLFPRLCEHSARAGYRVYFLGGAPDAATKARAVLERRFPGLRVVGCYCPPIGFEKKDEERQRVLDAVRSAKPQILFVGLGSPKQERWIVANMQAIDPAVCVGVGISFSFVAGHVKRAPHWMRRFGAEWLHRLCMEPRRLWKRYLVQGWLVLPIAARDVARTYLGRNAPHGPPGLGNSRS